MSYTQLLYHIVFRTKYSAQAISIEHEQLLYNYIWGLCMQRNVVLSRIGGMPDHIHMLVQLPATMSVSDFVRDIKALSSKFLRDNLDKFPLFLGWGKSFCALSITNSDKDRVYNYIKNQKEHHLGTSLNDEIVTLLNDANIPFEPKYLFGD